MMTLEAGERRAARQRALEQMAATRWAEGRRAHDLWWGCEALASLQLGTFGRVGHLHLTKGDLKRCTCRRRRRTQRQWWW